MIYRDFGNSGIKVSALGFGAGHIGAPEMEEKKAETLLNTVLDLGINLFDTARSYGLSEKRIGQYLAHRRTEFVISTKVGYNFEWKDDWSYDATMGTVDQALQLMRTDYLDIVHLHSCDKFTLERGDATAALEKAREQGKIRVIAYSGENDALGFAIDSGRFGSLQCSVNICDQHSLERYLPQAKEKGMGVIAKRPIANAPWRYSSRPEGHGHAVYWDRMQVMKIDPHGLDWNELALRFTAFAPGVHSCIAGTSSLGHFMQNLEQVNKGPLEETLIEQIRSEFSRCDSNWDGLI
jgi:aryl-alcohol dehydrogenase-like predicted oxidoreductase